MRRTTVAAVAVAIPLVLLSADANAAVVATPVKTDPDRREILASGNADYFAWSQDQADAYFQLDVWVQPTGGTEYKVKSGGGQAWAGQMDHTGSLLPYANCIQDACDIVLFDMATKTKQPLPPGINTTKHEIAPALYGDQMTFLRYGRTWTTLYLVTDLSTGAKIAVRRINQKRGNFASDDPRLTGNWVTYAVCNRVGCNAFRYDIAGASTTRVANPVGKPYFAPSADIAGNVYFDGSGPGCTKQVRLMKWTGSGDPTTFYTFDSPFASGTDMRQTSVYDDGAGNVLLYADFRDCTTGNSDVYSFTIP